MKLGGCKSLSLIGVTWLLMGSELGWAAKFPNIDFREPVSESNEVGNGGKVVFCPAGVQGPQETHEVLDYFEQRERWNMQLHLGGSELDYKGKALLVVDRIARYEPLRAERYRMFIQSFGEPGDFVGGVLPSVDDTGFTIVPEGCELKQAAIQRNSDIPGDKYFLFSRIVWNSLDENSKAGLLLHELIYRDAVVAGHKNSARTRYFNALFASIAEQELLGGMKSEYQALLQNLDLPGKIAYGNHSIGGRGVIMPYDSLEFDWTDHDAGLPEEQYIVSGRDSGIQSDQFLGNGFTGKFLPTSTVFFDSSGLIDSVSAYDEQEAAPLLGIIRKRTRFEGFSSTARVQFLFVPRADQIGDLVTLKFGNGRPERLFNEALNNGDMPITRVKTIVDFEIMPEGQSVVSSRVTGMDTGDFSIEFHSTGVPKSVLLSTGRVFYRARNVAKALSFNAMGHTKFYENGLVQMTSLADNSIELETTQGVLKIFHRGDVLIFNEDGLVVQ